MILLHSSDLHGKYRWLLRELAKKDYDVWVDTGDTLPNTGDRPVSICDESDYQERILHRGGGALLKKIAKALKGRPMLCVSGNHDFVDIAPFLRKHGVNAKNVQGGPCEVNGKVFWGFGQIPFIQGEWQGEVHDFTPMLDQLCKVSPDVLLTHAPPQGTLDTSRNYGIPGLANTLAYHVPNLQAHLFGHCHSDGGKVREVMDVVFSNAATKVQRVEV